MEAPEIGQRVRVTAVVHEGVALEVGTEFTVGAVCSARQYGPDWVWLNSGACSGYGDGEHYGWCQWEPAVVAESGDWIEILEAPYAEDHEGRIVQLVGYGSHPARGGTFAGMFDVEIEGDALFCTFQKATYEALADQLTLVTEELSKEREISRLLSEDVATGDDVVDLVSANAGRCSDLSEQGVLGMTFGTFFLYHIGCNLITGLAASVLTKLLTR